MAMTMRPVVAKRTAAKGLVRGIGVVGRHTKRIAASLSSASLGFVVSLSSVVHDRLGGRVVRLTRGVLWGGDVLHLLLGHPHDPCCAGVLERLQARGVPARIVTDPLAPPARFVWRLDASGPIGRLALDGACDEAIDGVLVRAAPWLDPAGWDPADHAYMQAETQAVLLAWLASLPCPVVNRASAAHWYRPRLPLLAWRPLLAQCALPMPDAVVTNAPDAAERFRRRLAADGVPGAVCTPLTSAAAWLVGPADWPRLAPLLDRTPVCLAEPHGAVTTACIVGGEIVWDPVPPAEAPALASGLRRLAEATGLTFVEVSFAPVREGLAVVAVDARPALEHFSAPAADRILDGLADLLTAGEESDAALEALA